MNCPEIIKESMFAPGLPDKGRYDPVDEMRGLTRMVIQKHQARQDHYDFRIADGSKVHSWSSKRLPYEKEKILMVQQPTHLASYMDFEGIIPEGYGAGKVKKIYDQVIDVVNSSEEKINFVLPEGEFAMIKMKGENPNWLLIKKKPVVNAVNSKPKYKEVSPEEISLEDENTALQPKIDGAHNIFELHSDNINRIYSYRNRKKDDIAIDHTHQVPLLRDAVVPKELDGTLLRGEIFAKDKSGNILPSTSIAGLLNANPIKSRLKQEDIGKLEPYIFDIVSYKDKNVEEYDYKDKFKILKDIEKKVPEMRVAETAFSISEKKKLFDKIKNEQHSDTQEGVILWDLSKSNPIKAKFKDNYEVYIRKIFKAESKSGKDFAGGFEFSWTPRGKVCGKIGTGFTAVLRKDMWKNPDKYVGRVARVKSQEKYETGALRAPSFYDFHMESLLKAAMECPEIIKMAWLPPKRVWGELSSKAWKTLKKTKFIKSDKEILKGIERGNVNILKKLKPEGWRIIDTRLRDAIRKRGPVRFPTRIVLAGPLTLGASKAIVMPAKKSIYGKMFYKGYGLKPQVAKRHELLEAIYSKKGKGFAIAKKRFKGKKFKKLKGMHYDPAVITRESNLMRGLKAKSFRKLRGKREGKVFENIIGKQYGKGYLSLTDAKKIRKGQEMFSGMPLPNWI